MDKMEWMEFVMLGKVCCRFCPVWSNNDSMDEWVGGGVQLRRHFAFISTIFGNLCGYHLRRRRRRLEWSGVESE